MEVHGTQPGNPRRPDESYERSQKRLRESDRERVRDARKLMEGLSEVRQEATREARQARQETGPEDRLELSSAAQTHEGQEVDAGREARIGELRRAYQEGKLNTPELIDRAAENILLG